MISVQILVGRGDFTDLPVRVRLGQERQKQEPVVNTLLSEYEEFA